MLRFLKTTVLGGILFLLPIVIFIVLIGKAFQIANKLALPIAGMLGYDAIAGMAVAEIISIGILVLVCFIAGLAAKTIRAKKFVRSLEVNVLEKIPAYEFLKTKTTSVLNADDAEGMCSVLVRFDESWQLAFEIERSQEGNVVIFLPAAPDPWSGSVFIVREDRVTPLDLTVRSTVGLMKRLGRGTTEALAEKRLVGKVAGQSVT